MDVFKTIPGTDERWPINEEEFTERTGKTAPFYQRDARGAHCYAVCPKCNNPITIVGLYKREEEQDGRKPYGRHHQGSIAKLADYDADEYWNCPYHNPANRRHEKRDREKAGTYALHDFVKNNYDAIIGVLEHATGIHISYEYAKTLLQDFVADEGWRYYDADFQNIPFMMMFARAADNLVGRLVRPGSAIAEELGKLPEVRLDPAGEYLQIWGTRAGFLYLDFRIIHHRYERNGEGLSETFILQIRLDNETVSDLALTVNPGEVRKAIDEETYRSRRIWRLGRELM